ncbi:SseB family protein [Arthrobacter sp. Br18]|uniref:SseB family protein n=1 Tax=Arthrobacter sp. Br18 TaxID=1312954 RepID=UPI00047CC627|nr:SseB family protein [Arthrobacter sp. Br18]
MTGRKLPAHIEAALAGQLADSAGRPWAGRNLAGPGNPLHNFDEDNGQADAGYAAAVRGLFDASLGPASREEAVIHALSEARVFIPIVAEVTQTAEGAGGRAADKEADMALVTLKAPDGRTALPVFSAAAGLAAWHPEARPVAVYTSRAALAAVAEKAELLVIDPGSSFTFVVRRPAVWALAQQLPWVPSYRDEALTGIIAGISGGENSILEVRVGLGSGVPALTADGRLALGGGSGPELRMDLKLKPDLPAAEVEALVLRFRSALQENREFVERVDSLELKLTR